MGITRRLPVLVFLLLAPMNTQAHPIPKRHHYVPISLLERFTNEDGKLYVFDKRLPEKGVRISTPEDVFVERHLYSIMKKDGTKDTWLEEEYADLEGVSKPVIGKIVAEARESRVPEFSTQEREIFDVFFYQQWKRVPQVRDKVFAQEDPQSRLSRSIAEFETEARPLTDAERRDYQDPETIKRLMHNAMITALAGPSSEVLALLREKGILIGIIRKATKSFVIGSLPVAKMTYPGREHLSDPSVEIWLPLAFDVVVTLASLPSARELLREMQDDAIVRHINETVFKQSTIIAGRSLKLLESLARPR
jgi:hypothetical protein